MYSMKKYQNMKTYRIFRLFDENKVNFSIRLKFEKSKIWSVLPLRVQAVHNSSDSEESAGHFADKPKKQL